MISLIIVPFFRARYALWVVRSYDQADKPLSIYEDWLSKVGLPYHSPHKFRHGFAVYAIKHAKDMSDMKAISQNLMHANISITDGIYGVLSDTDIKNRITGLRENRDIDLTNAYKKLEEAIDQIKKERK